MTQWLGNVPEQHVKFSKSIPAQEHEKLEQLLEFIQLEQPGATMDHLFEEVMNAFFRKRNTSFPAPPPTTALRVSIPKKLKSQIEGHVGAARQENPRATEEDLVAFAIKSFFSRSNPMLSAWRDFQSSGSSADTASPGLGEATSRGPEPLEAPEERAPEGEPSGEARRQDLIDRARRRAAGTAEAGSGANEHVDSGDDRIAPNTGDVAT